MSYPDTVKIVDLMMGIPVSETNQEWYDSFMPMLKDKESIDQFKMPAQYMFRDVPLLEKTDDYVTFLVGEMDKYNIDIAMVGYFEGSEAAAAAKKNYPDRFIFDFPVDPNQGMDAVRAIRRAHTEFGISSVSVFPCGCNPQVPIDDRKMWLIYGTCCELGLPILVNVGVPGPRIPMAPQKVELVDEVCYHFPELKFVMRHGGEPWDELAIKLMLKWPNLYYSTSAFAPKHYPKSIIRYMNSRGADKIMYAGYYPQGLSLERIFEDLPNVPIKNDEIWVKFLSDNARQLFELPQA
ncbi:amidohydrolase family protein [Pseudomonadales bacterium]|jgi:predicted TIM-barrel fold metal-dependent hydrolase|nr:amidohydrolase family protein [Pseudomonadales bacterium]